MKLEDILVKIGLSHGISWKYFNTLFHPRFKNSEKSVTQALSYLSLLQGTLALLRGKKTYQQEVDHWP